MRKFHRNKDRERKWEPPKPMETEGSNATTKQLTDLDDDCLEHIFAYLSLEDLLSVVHTNKHLTTAAELAFVRNFGRKKIVDLVKQYKQKPIVRIWFNKTEKVALKNPYRLLRCFGHLILRLKITVPYKRCAYKVLKYVNKYCRETTTEIAFDLRYYINCINEPYPNVETVSFESYYFYKKYPTFVQMNELFPNVRNLSISRCNFKREYIALHFPQLNQLQIGYGFYLSPERTYHSMTYAEMLRLNPQLRSLTLSIDYTEALLRFASQYLPSLEHLEIEIVYEYSNIFDDGVINFPSLKELKIGYFPHDSIKIAISAPILETFSFQFDPYDHSNMDFLLDFLHNHPNITKFNLTNPYQYLRTTKVPIDILEALPFLEEVDISMLTISVNDAIRFVAKCKSLKKFCFETDQTVDVNHLKERVGAKYHVECTKIEKSNGFKLYCITIVAN